MSKCERCNNRRTITLSSGGIIVVQPCPVCNELTNDKKDGKYLREVLACIQSISEVAK